MTDYLNAPGIQNLLQLALYEGAFQGLLDTGILTGDEPARYIGTFLQPAVRYGVDAVVAWVKGTASADLSSFILVAARQGQYAIDFITTYGNVLNVAPEPGTLDITVIRDEVDQAVTDIIGNPKIPNIEYANVAVANVTGNIAVTITGGNNDDGTFRFAPGSRQG